MSAIEKVNYIPEPSIQRPLYRLAVTVPKMAGTFVFKVYPDKTGFWGEYVETGTAMRVRTQGENLGDLYKNAVEALTLRFETEKKQ